MSETKKQRKTTIKTVTDTEAWFNNFIAESVHSIRVDELALKTKTADPTKERIYGNLMAGKNEDVIDEFKDLILKHYVSTITLTYVKELQSKIQPTDLNKLAFRLTNSKILVWAEIKNDNEDCEDALILTEAKINAMFGDKGFHISSTIVEESDNIKLPPHYVDIVSAVSN